MERGVINVVIGALWIFIPASTIDPGSVASTESKPIKAPVILRAGDNRFANSGATMDMYPDHIDATIEINNRTRQLRLMKKLDLLGSGYREIYYENERRVVTTPALHPSDFCYYEGAVADDTKSHAAINLCKEISGTLYLDGLRYEVLSVNETGTLFLTPAAPGNESHRCGHSSSHPKSVKTRVKRAIQIPAYYKKYVNWKELYVELAIVFDSSVYWTAGGDKKRLFDRAKELANFMNSYYQPVNIKVALVGVEIWTDKDRVTVTDNGDTTLDQFLQYRKTTLSPSIPNDHAQLITTMQFANGVVGKAMKGTMCSSELSGAVIMDHSRYAATVAATMAHEMGHNFGMEHDNDTCQCPQPKCIMAASSSGSGNVYWSSCSMEYLSWGLSRGADFCLKNKPTNTFDPKSPICGNGFVEDGEQCDCGLPGVCDNPCCNATTCQLAQGAVCANGGCCDTSKCQLKPTASVCRDSADECDLAEYCDGKSETCPNDTHKHNGISCGDKGYCYQGTCKSHESQCKLIWGSTGAMGSSECYGLNSKGDAQGNCGFHRTSGTYTACADADKLCGALQCYQKTERPQYGDRSLVRTAYTEFRYRDRSVLCYTVNIDLGSDDSDPGLVPNGAQCGTEKMCRNQKCVNVKDVMAEIPCEIDCRGNGVCNNFGHCHCDVGYGGADCGSVGLGGSVDSGPASIGGKGFNVGLGVLIFVIIILPLISALLTYMYKKGKIRSPAVAKVFHKPSSTKKPRASSRPPASASTRKPPPGSTTSPSTPQKANVSTTPGWPLPQSNCAVTNSSKSFPKPTVTVNLQDGLVPVFVAIASSTTALSNHAIVSPPGSTAAPARPKRPTDDSMTKVHQLDETTSYSNNVGDQNTDVILPSRRAPPPPTAGRATARNCAEAEQIASAPAANKRKLSEPSSKVEAVGSKSAQVQHPKPASSSNGQKILPAAKSKLGHEEPATVPNVEVNYTKPEKKPKPTLPPIKPNLVKANPVESTSEVPSTYYDVVHSRAETSGGALPKMAVLPPIHQTKESKPAKNLEQKNDAQLKSAFAADLEKKLKKDANESKSAPSGKKALVPPTLPQSGQNANKEAPGKNNGQKGDSRLVSALAARFEKQN